MILKGSQRGSALQLARHLMNPMDNDHVEVHQLRGFISDDLAGAFKETQAISRGTRCSQFLFSLSLNPPETEKVSVSAFEDAIERIEKKLGLVGQPRAIVFHEKSGRRHAHCVWSRIDAGQMKAINLPHYKMKLQDVARGLYRTHQWDMPEGFKDHEQHDPLNYSQAEGWQAKRVKTDPKTIKALFKRCWEQSDSRGSFAHALREHGFILAKGDRRGFVAVDAQGEVYSVSRWCGVKVKDVRARFEDHSDLPSVEQAMATFDIELTDEHQDSVKKADTNLEQRLAAFEQKRQELLKQQREERQTLKQVQAQLRKEAIQQFRNEFPTGLKATWMKLSGQYQARLDGCKKSLLTLKEQDAQEHQSLVEKQLKERRKLQHELLQLHLHHDIRTRALWKETGSLLHRIDIEDDPHDHFQPVIDPKQPLVLLEEKEALSLKARVKLAPETILDVISDKQDTFSRNDIVRGLAKYIEEPLLLQPAIDRVLTSKDLVVVSGKPESSTSTRYTTRELQQLKSTMLAQASDLSRNSSFAVSPSLMKFAIAEQNQALQKSVGANLSDEQIEAIKHVLQPQQLSNVVGLAGAGKSTLLSAARFAWERQGYRVIGAALSGKAADGLEQSSGIQSRTLASLEYSWKHGYSQLEANDVVVIDEAGMVGTRQMARFINKVKQAGAKLVLVGDPEQLQPVEAGTPFKEIVEQSSASQLTEIHRQKQDWQREASKLLATQQTGKALRVYEDKGYVTCTHDRSEAISHLVESYMSDLNLHGNESSRLALAHRRKDVHLINQSIRNMRQASGELWDEQLFRTDHGPRAFATGDRILLTKNDREIGIRNGMLGTVEVVTENSITIALDSQDKEKPRRITIAPDVYSSLDHGYATTIHKSQGATLDRTFVLGSSTMDRHLAYVAMTRHKEEVQLFMDNTTRQKLSRLSEEAHVRALERKRPHLRRDR